MSEFGEYIDIENKSCWTQTATLHTKKDEDGKSIIDPF